MIASLKAAGKNYVEIAGELNRFGFTTAKGKSFYPMQVRQLCQRMASELPDIDER